MDTNYYDYGYGLEEVQDDMDSTDYMDLAEEIQTIIDTYFEEDDENLGD